MTFYSERDKGHEEGGGYDYLQTSRHPVSPLHHDNIKDTLWALVTLSF
jgi:hypothetical protein